MRGGRTATRKGARQVVGALHDHDAPARPGGRPGALLELQRTVGNRAVSGLLRGDRTDAETETDEAESAETETGSGAETPGPEAETGAEETETEEAETTVTGTVPEAVVNAEASETEAVSWGPPPGVKADTPHGVAPGGAARQPEVAGGAGRRSHRIVVDEVGLDLSERQAPSVDGVRGDGVRGDGIAASTTVNWSMNGDHNADAFGEMVPSYRLGDMQFAVKSSKKANTVKLKVTVDGTTSWGIASGGNIDVPSGDADVVTADNWQEIVEDLTPRTGSYRGRDFGGSWVAFRSRYWSEALTARHEKFHCTDERDWLKSQGKRFFTKYLNDQTVGLDDTERKDPAKIRVKLADVLEDARKALVAASDTFYMGTGVTYYNRPGEIRAFGDGKAPYQKLADAVKKRGKVLEAKKRKEEAKKAKATQAPKD